MAARSGETGTGSTEGNSAVANGDGPQTTDNRENIVTSTSEQQAVPVTQEDLELAESIVSRTRGFGVKLRKTDSRAIDIARHRLAALRTDATQTREAELVAAITRALECTPSISLPGYLEARIVYDCGDPWEILRAALNARDGA